MSRSNGLTTAKTQYISNVLCHWLKPHWGMIKTDLDVTWPISVLICFLLTTIVLHVKVVFLGWHSARCDSMPITVASHELRGTSNCRQFQCLFNSLFTLTKERIHAPHYCPFVRRIHGGPVHSPHRGLLMRITWRHCTNGRLKSLLARPGAYLNLIYQINGLAHPSEMLLWSVVHIGYSIGKS